MLPDDERRIGRQIGRRDVAGQRSEVGAVGVVRRPGADLTPDARERDQRVGFDRAAREHLGGVATGR